MLAFCYYNYIIQKIITSQYLMGMSLRSKVSFDLPNYTWPWNGRIEISPRMQPWYSISELWCMWSTDITAWNISWVKKSWARFLEIDRWSWNHPARIVEHILSSLAASWITNADVATTFSQSPWILWWDMWYTPIIWPWIEPLYWVLSWLPKTSINMNEEQYRVLERMEFAYGSAKMIVEPSDSFDVHISTVHKDITELWSKPLEVQDVLSQVAKHASARPLARLQGRVKYNIFRALNCFESTVINAINPKTYIMWLPWDKGEDIAWKMQEQYQEDRNEHLFHTLYSDFIWELAIFFPWNFNWKITLIDTKHTSRIPLLQMLLESWVARRIGK